MTIKLHSLARWTLLKAGDAIHFDAGRVKGERRVRLHLNCALETAFYLENVDGPRLLAVVGPGLETVEFQAAGKFAVFSEENSESEVWYQTTETEPSHVTVLDPVVFTKIAQRKQRNPELEHMMLIMRQNNERMLAAQEAAFDRKLATAMKGLSNGETGIHVGAAAERPQPDEAEGEATDAGSEGDGAGGDDAILQGTAEAPKRSAGAATQAVVAK